MENLIEYQVATDLSSNETNVTVSSYDELMKMTKLVGKYELYIYTPIGWETVGSFEDMGNDLKELF